MLTEPTSDRSAISRPDNIDTARASSAYALLDSPLAEHFRARYFTLSQQALAAAPQKIAARRNRLWAIVPMAEQQPEFGATVGRVARYLSTRLPRGRAIFLDGGSCPENVDAARSGGAVVLRQDDIFDAIAWDRLLPILNRARRPAGRAGQGFNVFAAHLVLAALDVGADDLIFQGDADIQNYEEIAPLERLVSAWVEEGECRHAKLAQAGRNNEIIMAARAMQQLFSTLDLPWVPAAVKQLGHQVFMALGPDKWLTCGMYFVTGAIALARPFASGYLDATTQALWTADAPECGWRRVRHVECPVACRDAENTTTKETLILSSVALYLQSVVMHGKAPHKWNEQDIARLNREVLPKLGDIPEIGDTTGPVSIHRIDQDRIIPSVRALCAAGIIELGVVRELVASAQAAAQRRAEEPGKVTPNA